MAVIFGFDPFLLVLIVVILRKKMVGNSAVLYEPLFYSFYSFIYSQNWSTFLEFIFQLL